MGDTIFEVAARSGAICSFQKRQKDFTSAKSFCYVNDYFLSAIAAFAFAAIFAAVRP